MALRQVRKSLKGRARFASKILTKGQSAAWRFKVAAAIAMQLFTKGQIRQSCQCMATGAYQLFAKGQFRESFNRLAIAAFQFLAMGKGRNDRQFIAS